jgi:hypothetical protein
MKTKGVVHFSTVQSDAELRVGRLVKSSGARDVKFKGLMFGSVTCTGGAETCATCSKQRGWMAVRTHAHFKSCASDYVAGWHASIHVRECGTDYKIHVLM